MPTIVTAGGSTKLKFDKSAWPSPLSISVEDSKGKSEKHLVQVDEGLLKVNGFTNPQEQ